MDALDKIAPSWVASLNELEDVNRAHTADTGSYRYKYADLATVCQQARQVLAGHGLAVQQFAHGDTLGVINVTTTVWHESGQSISAPPLTMPARGGPQDVGSAISYARRYALMAFLGLATDDDDGAGAQKAATEADKPHPLSERVGTVTAELKQLTDTQKEEVRSWADGRSLAPGQLLRNESFLTLVETWLDEHTQKGSE